MHTNLSPAATSNATAFSPPPPRSCVTLITVEASLSRSPPKRKCHSAQAESRWLLTAFFAASNPHRECRLRGMTLPVLVLSCSTVFVFLATSKRKHKKPPPITHPLFRGGLKVERLHRLMLHPELLRTVSLSCGAASGPVRCTQRCCCRASARNRCRLPR